MTLAEVMAELESKGSAQTKKTFLRHGAREPFFGVKVGDLKVLQKKIKTDHKLALELYATGNADAMYLAGMVADPPNMSKGDLKKWMKGAYWYMPAEYTVAWTAAESRFAVELAEEWIQSKKEATAAGGWSTLSSYVAITPDAELDATAIGRYLAIITTGIGTAPNRVKYTMNGFLIAVGCHVASLSRMAEATARSIGSVHVDMGDTDCKVPDAVAYIRKVADMGRTGKKRASAFC